MWRQIKLLSGIRLCNCFGLNEARFGKDRKKKRSMLLMGCIFILLGILLVFYVGMMSYAYIELGMAEIVPAYLFAVTSLLILVFTFLKAGNVIFDLRQYEKEIVLPVKPSAIVISRFLTMYLFNMAMSLLVMLPGSAMYAWFVRPEASFYCMTLIGTLLLPLLPMTISTAAGALILAISSRVKHKNLIALLLFMGLTVGVLVLSGVLSMKGADITEYDLANLSAVFLAQIGRYYPPAMLFSSGVVNGAWEAFLLFAALSVGLFSAFVLLTQFKFVEICTALGTSAAKGNYTLTELKQRAPLKALYGKEIRRYFASSLYVINTSIGYVMMVVFAIAVLAVGQDMINEMLYAEEAVQQFAPLILAAMCVISPSTSSAVSMEGRQWWIVKSLPVSAKTVFDSKILVNLSVAVPCYLISVCLLSVAIRFSAAGYLWLWLLPLLYLLFSSVLGIYVNARLPKFNWESEAVVVKQGAPVLICMLAGFVSVAVPLVLLIVLPSGAANLVLMGIAVLIAAVTAALYRSNQRLVLSGIGE